jgi:hypothetical protein
VLETREGAAIYFWLTRVLPVAEKGTLCDHGLSICPVKRRFPPAGVGFPGIFLAEIGIRDSPLKAAEV